MRKRTFRPVRTTKTYHNLCIRAFWSESSLSTWRHIASLTIQNAPRRDSDQTAWIHKLILILAGSTSEGYVFWRYAHLIFYLFRRQISDDICRLLFYFDKLSLGKTLIYKVDRLNVKQRRSRWDGSLSCLIWIYAVCKSLLLSSVAVKELNNVNVFRL